MGQLPPGLPLSLADAARRGVPSGAPPLLLVAIDPALKTPGAPARREGEGTDPSPALFRTSADGDPTPRPPPDLSLLFTPATPIEWIVKRSASNPFTSMVTLGRAGNNDICVKSGTLSSVHLIFTLGDPITVTDQASTNGSRLNGVELAAREGVPIRSGDYLLLGGSVRVLFLAADALAPFAARVVART